MEEKERVEERVEEQIETQEQATELIFKDAKLAAELEGKQIKKLIIIPSRLINIIV